MDILIYCMLILLILWFFWFSDFSDSLILLILWFFWFSDSLILWFSDSLILWFFWSSDSTYFLILLILWFLWFSDSSDSSDFRKSENQKSEIRKSALQPFCYSECLILLISDNQESKTQLSCYSSSLLLWPSDIWCLSQPAILCTAYQPWSDIQAIKYNVCSDVSALWTVRIVTVQMYQACSLRISALTEIQQGRNTCCQTFRSIKITDVPMSQKILQISIVR